MPLAGSALALLSVTSLTSHKWTVAFQMLICRWVGLYTFQDPVGVSHGLTCDPESFSHCHNSCIFLCIYLFILIYFIDYAITVVPFLPLHSIPSCTPPSSHIPLLWFMSMGHTYRFFGFYISYTILTLPLSIFDLPFMLLIPCTFPLSPPPTPLLITLHVISISVILSGSSCLLSLVLFLF